MKTNVRRLTMYALFSALAYVAMLFIRIPVVMFLKYEPKDVIIALGSFILGPVSAIIISLITSLAEFLTVSDTGWIGLLMNFLSSACFAGVAGLVYWKKRTISGAVIGLTSATLLTTALMLLWNYLITPIYMGYPREAVAELLIPVFLPFNLLKYFLDSALIMMLYKPVSAALRRTTLLSSSSSAGASDKTVIRKNITIGVAVISVILALSCILLMLVLGGKM